MLYDEANENEAEIRHAAQLHALAKRVTDDVRALSGRGSQSAAMAATLALLSGEARAFKIDVRSIVPTTAAPPVASSLLAGAPIEIDVRGHFRELLAFVSDLPRHNVLIDVSDVSLDDDGDGAPSPILSAKIHATLFRYRGNAGEEMEYASGAL
jgi:Tfp pilus assembly protein PilO